MAPSREREKIIRNLFSVHRNKTDGISKQSRGVDFFVRSGFR